MKRAILIGIAKKYFEAFQSKNIDTLNEILDSNVQLTDPVNKTIYGKKQVLAANQNIFNDAKSIKLHVKNLFIDEVARVIIGELKILIDDTHLDVIDIIHVNEKEFIYSIIACINPIDN